jgi:hypothetical protein
MRQCLEIQLTGHRHDRDRHAAVHGGDQRLEHLHGRQAERYRGLDAVRAAA